MKRLILLIPLLVLLGSGCDYRVVSDNQYNFDLSSKCSQQASSFFAKKREESSSIFTTYTNHYNNELNKCFVLAPFTQFDDLKLEKGKILFDVLENKTVGFYMYSEFPGTPDMVLSCSIEDTTCKNQEQFDNLTKAYITN